MNVARRIEELEKRMGSGKEPCIWWIVFVDPKEGERPEESVSGYTSGGKRWERRASESVQELRERVQAEVQYNEWGAAVAIECYAREPAGV